MASVASKLRSSEIKLKWNIMLTSHRLSTLGDRQDCEDFGVGLSLPNRVAVLCLCLLNCLHCPFYCMYLCMWIYIAQLLQPKQSRGASIG